ncbi:MAG: hypothetical protein R8K47_02140, partial [Mariprofundaceae bacterium]
MKRLSALAWALILGCAAVSIARAQEGIAPREEVRAMWLAPVWWSYGETSGPRPGYAQTPFDSRASGAGARLGFRLADALADRSGWRIMLEGGLMLPLNRVRERWDLPATVQENDLELVDAEAWLGIGYRRHGWMFAVEGGWSGQRQRRTRFVVGGAP